MRDIVKQSVKRWKVAVESHDAIAYFIRASCHVKSNSQYPNNAAVRGYFIAGYRLALEGGSYKQLDKSNVTIV